MAAEITSPSVEHGASGDVVTLMLWRQVRAKVLARRGVLVARALERVEAVIPDRARREREARVGAHEHVAALQRGRLTDLSELRVLE